jgi:chromosomal replication initiator protein
VSAIRRELADRVGIRRFELWFLEGVRWSLADDALTVSTANSFAQDFLRKTFSASLREACVAAAGRPLDLRFEVDSSLAPGESGGSVADGEGVADDSAGQRLAADPPPAPAAPHAEPSSANGSAAPRSGRRFANFAGLVEGAGNKLAASAARNFADRTAPYASLFLYGPTGVGKTHLLRATVGEFRRCHPRVSAVYLSAEQFTTGFVEAIRGSGLPNFRQKCRGALLLAIDDLQFFIGKQRTLEELQYTIDHLLAAGRQLILGGDRCLAELQALGAEMTSRLSGGLICEIEPPEFATRLQIARNLSREMGLPLGDDVLRTIAAQIAAGARELRGALHRLQAVSQAHQQPITRALADQTLADLARHCTRAVRLGDVQAAVCDVFGLEPAQLRSDRKGRAVSEPRMLAMWLARKYTRAAWSEIGEFFGRRSHSTVIAAHRRVERMISTQAEIGIRDRPCRVEDAIRRLETAIRTA